jgi:hypothetical protein
MAIMIWAKSWQTPRFSRSACSIGECTSVMPDFIFEGIVDGLAQLAQRGQRIAFGLFQIVRLHEFEKLRATGRANFDGSSRSK